MATSSFHPCPHCGRPLIFLEGVTASTDGPRCPHCRKRVEVEVATFLMLDTSALGAVPMSAVKK